MAKMSWNFLNNFGQARLVTRLRLYFVILFLWLLCNLLCFSFQVIRDWDYRELPALRSSSSPVIRDQECAILQAYVTF